MDYILLMTKMLFFLNFVIYVSFLDLRTVVESLEILPIDGRYIKSYS